MSGKLPIENTHPIFRKVKFGGRKAPEIDATLPLLGNGCHRPVENGSSGSGIADTLQHTVNVRSVGMISPP